MNKTILIALALISTNAFANEDNRQIVNLSETNRNLVLTEMRTLLSGTQSILDALANEDMNAVAEAAKPLGMSMAHNAENHLHNALPREFMMLGKTVHISFDEIARDAQEIGKIQHTLKQLNQMMGQCTACHATYQILPIARQKVGEPK